MAWREPHLLIPIAFAAGCGAAPAIPVSIAQVERPVQAQVAPSEDPARPDPPPRRKPEAGRTCGLHWQPRDVGGVLIIPASVLSPAMGKVIEALCACSAPGEYADVRADIEFHDGKVGVSAKRSPVIDGCLSQVPVRFEPYRPDGPLSDCIGCGPRRYGVFHGSAPANTPEPPGRLRVVMAFRLDRSNEVLDCAPGTHPEAGKCRDDLAPQPTPAGPPTCGCSPQDLACAIDCAVGATHATP